MDSEGDCMFYNILAIIIGIFLILNLIFTFASKKKERLSVLLINLFASLCFLGMGIGGFFVPKDYEYVTTLILLVLSVFYLVFFFVQSKKSKKSQKTK